MLNVTRTADVLLKYGVMFVTGVPDSILAPFCNHLCGREGISHVVSHNEGAAVALAAGRFLGSGLVSLVYMQNSGQGNAVNPLASLASPLVYGVPMLLLVGMRGEAGTEDEPQHIAQGNATRRIFGALGVECIDLPSEEPKAFAAIASAIDLAKSCSGPVALLVRAGTFEPSAAIEGIECGVEIDRLAAIRAVLLFMRGEDCMVTTTGEISREALQLEHHSGRDVCRILPSVGSMGHASQIALGIALSNPNRRVFCVDGDGAALMHMGAFATIGQQSPCNLTHILLNNGAHMSVGGLPSAGGNVDFARVAVACGYRWSSVVDKAADLTSSLSEVCDGEGPRFLEIRVTRKAAGKLPRPCGELSELGARFRQRLLSTLLPSALEDQVTTENRECLIRESR